MRVWIESEPRKRIRMSICPAVVCKCDAGYVICHAASSFSHTSSPKTDCMGPVQACTVDCRVLSRDYKIVWRLAYARTQQLIAENWAVRPGGTTDNESELLTSRVNTALVNVSIVSKRYYHVFFCYLLNLRLVILLFTTIDYVYWSLWACIKLCTHNTLTKWSSFIALWGHNAVGRINSVDTCGVKAEKLLTFPTHSHKRARPLFCPIDELSRHAKVGSVAVCPYDEYTRHESHA